MCYPAPEIMNTILKFERSLLSLQELISKDLQSQIFCISWRNLQQKDKKQ